MIGFFLFILISTFSLNSCSDSYGTDPDVRITLIEDNQTGVDTTVAISDTKFQLATIWNFAEYFKDHKRGKAFIWGPNVNEVTDYIQIDTAKQKIIFWMEYEANSALADNMLKNRDDRVISFKIIADSLELNLLHENINYASTKNLEAFVTMKDLRKNEIKEIKATGESFFFSVRRNPISGNLEGMINIDIFMIENWETYKFQAVFEGIMP